MVLGLGIVSVWLIVFVFRITDRRLPSILALSLAYAIAAYVILPRVVRMAVKILQRKSVPSFTVTGDGLPGDPVNLALIGEVREAPRRVREGRLDGGGPPRPRELVADGRGLRLQPPLSGRAVQHALPLRAGAGHRLSEGDRRQPAQAPSYPVLGHEFGARRRHPGTAAFWRNKDRPPLDAPALWVGAGTRDTGFSLTAFTFQVTHATDDDTNAERDFIVGELKGSGTIGDVTWHRRGERIHTGRVNHYITDGEVAAASLA